MDDVKSIFTDEDSLNNELVKVLDALAANVDKGIDILCKYSQPDLNMLFIQLASKFGEAKMRLDIACHACDLLDAACDADESVESLSEMAEDLNESGFEN
jgi:hypothetical protein